MACEIGDVFNGAADRIESKGWCQESFARDAEGMAVDYEDKSAVAFCMIGACWRTMDEIGAGDDHFLTEEVEAAAKEKLGESMDAWNDTEGRTKEEVVQKLREMAVENGGDEHAE